MQAAQIHEQPIWAAKDHVQPLAAIDSFLPNGKKDSDLTPFIIRAGPSSDPVCRAGIY